MAVQNLIRSYQVSLDRHNSSYWFFLGDPALGQRPMRCGGPEEGLVTNRETIQCVLHMLLLCTSLRIFGSSICWFFYVIFCAH